MKFKIKAIIYVIELKTENKITKTQMFHFSDSKNLSEANFELNR